jgi:hypothetical protein
MCAHCRQTVAAGNKGPEIRAFSQLVGEGLCNDPIQLASASQCGLFPWAPLKRPLSRAQLAFQRFVPIQCGLVLRVFPGAPLLFVLHFAIKTVQQLPDGSIRFRGPYRKNVGIHEARTFAQIGRPKWESFGSTGSVLVSAAGRFQPIPSGATGNLQAGRSIPPILPDHSNELTIRYAHPVRLPNSLLPG